MDYGQLAYVKVQEIEAYLRRAATSKQIGTAASASFYPHAAFSPALGWRRAGSAWGAAHGGTVLPVH